MYTQQTRTFICGHTAMNLPRLVRSAQTSIAGAREYWRGWPVENTVLPQVFFLTKFCLSFFLSPWNPLRKSTRALSITCACNIRRTLGLDDQRMCNNFLNFCVMVSLIIAILTSWTLERPEGLPKINHCNTEAIRSMLLRSTQSLWLVGWAGAPNQIFEFRTERFDSVRLRVHGQQWSDLGAVRWASRRHSVRQRERTNSWRRNLAKISIFGKGGVALRRASPGAVMPPQFR